MTHVVGKVIPLGEEEDTWWVPVQLIVQTIDDDMTEETSAIATFLVRCEAPGKAEARRTAKGSTWVAIGPAQRQGPPPGSDDEGPCACLFVANYTGTRQGDRAQYDRGYQAGYLRAKRRFAPNESDDGDPPTG